MGYNKVSKFQGGAMPRFFIDTPPTSQEILITGDDAWHIGRSLRMRVGDNLTVCCQKVDYFCEILSITQENVRLSVKSQSPSAEPSISLFVYIALPKLDKLELIAQKCTELGASKIIPVLMIHKPMSPVQVSPLSS